MCLVSALKLLCLMLDAYGSIIDIMLSLWFANNRFLFFYYKKINNAIFPHFSTAIQNLISNLWFFTDAKYKPNSIFYASSFFLFALLCIFENSDSYNSNVIHANYNREEKKLPVKKMILESEIHVYTYNYRPKVSNT